MLELTKKGYSTFKYKQKIIVKWFSSVHCRGRIAMDLNPLLAGWATHKLENNYTTEVII